jgi:uncharacterized GH25 family protein
MTTTQHLLRTIGLATLASTLATAIAPSAGAHTSYMRPAIFSANTENYITVESAFAEKFFHPEVAVDAADFHVITPDGTRAEFDAISKHRQLVILEAPIKGEGTYRFTTGVRRGRIGKIALVGNEWKPVREDGVPAGATQTKTTQTETVADVYVTKKAPTRAPVDVQIGRLIIQPLNHPADVATDAPLQIKLFFDGQAMAGQTLVLDRAGTEYDEQKFHKEVRTGSDGSLTLSLDQPGVYVAMARHRANAPAGSDTEERSYTTSLTFEVQR